MRMGMSLVRGLICLCIIEGSEADLLSKTLVRGSDVAGFRYLVFVSSMLVCIAFVSLES